MQRSRKEVFPDEDSDELLKVERKQPKIESKRGRAAKGSEVSKTESKSRSKSKEAVHSKLHIEKVKSQKLPEFDDPMNEFFNSNMMLTKVLALGLAIKVKLFDFIKEKGGDDFVKATELKEFLKLPLHIKQFISLLDKLEFHGYLDKKETLLDSKYKNSEYTNKYFTSSSEINYSFVYSNVDRYFSKFVNWEDNLKQGTPVNINDDIYADKDQTRNFTDFYSKINQRNFENLIKNFDFGRYKTVADLNGKNAEMSIKIKKKNPEVKVISFDNKAIEEVARENLKKAQMEDKVELVFGDIRIDQIPSCDVAIVPHILQYFEEDKKKKILESVHKSLNANGVLIIIENLIYDSKKDIEIPANKISFLLALENYEGCSLTSEEYEQMLTEAGFKDIKKFHKEWISFVIVAVKKEKEIENKPEEQNEQEKEPDKI